MYVDFLVRVFEESAAQPALIYKDQPTTYAQLLDLMKTSSALIEGWGVQSGDVVALRADYSPHSIGLLLALAARGVIVLQAGLAEGTSLSEILETGEAEWLVQVSPEGSATAERLGRKAGHGLYEKLRAQGHPGLVLFSSGSTGTRKGTVHDLTRLLKKFHARRRNLRTLAFLLFDHIGGLDTLFYCLSNGSALVLVEQRDVATVCAAVGRHKVEVLPVAPAFLNLLYFSREFERYDLTSLQCVTYGAELMPEQTLKFCAEMFPNAKLLQKYGTSETGSPQSQSRSSDSLWIKFGGDGYQWRVVDGMLQIKTESAMLGYLNAPSPFTEDGWFVTRDRVEVDGEYLRFLGRDSDLISVGGKKVYPAEVEAVLRHVPEVREVTVYGERNVLLGQIVAAKVWAAPVQDESALRQKILLHASKHLEDFKLPRRITFAFDQDYANVRFKKVRVAQ